jgi:hypothetical protein
MRSGSPRSVYEGTEWVVQKGPATERVETWVKRAS